jgi:DDE family transposase
MLNTASPFDSGWHDILARLPADLDLDILARETKALRRCRAVSDGSDLLRLGLARGPGGLSLAQAAAWASSNGIGEFSGEALNKRLHRSVTFFTGIVRRLLDARAPAKASPWHGRCLRMHDSSSLSQPGSKGSNWRVHAVYDLTSASFSHLELTDERGAEGLTYAAAAEGEIAIADRGYARAKEMAAFLAREGGGTRDFIVRTGWNSLRLENPNGSVFDLIAALTDMSAVRVADTSVPREWTGRALYGRGRHIRRLPIRLILLALPPDKAEAAREKVRRIARKQQTKLNPNTVLAAGFLMLATSLPADFPGAEIGAVYRLRWQIELAFKRLKSLIRVDRLPTRTENGGRSWILAHLILALLTEDMCQDILDFSPSGPG